jgi:hypothetical protein
MQLLEYLVCFSLFAMLLLFFDFGGLYFFGFSLLFVCSIVASLWEISISVKHYKYIFKDLI